MTSFIPRIPPRAEKKLVTTSAATGAKRTNNGNWYLPPKICHLKIQLSKTSVLEAAKP
jgi:hypothetical protein